MKKIEEKQHGICQISYIVNKQRIKMTFQNVKPNIKYWNFDVAADYSYAIAGVGFKWRIPFLMMIDDAMIMIVIM